MSVAPGDRGRGSGPGHLHADARLPPRLRRVRREDGAALRGELRHGHGRRELPFVAVLRAGTS